MPIEQAGIQEVKVRSVLTCELVRRHLRQVLRPRPRARHAGQHRRSGRRHRRPVDRRAGHPAHHAHLPHRRCGAGREQSFVESNFDGKVVIKNKAIARNSEGHLIAMVRNMVVAIVDADGTERATHRIQYGARLQVDEGDTVKRGQRIAEWDPYTAASPDRGRGHDRVRGPGRGPVDLGNARRNDRYRQARRHRLAHDAWRRRPASGDRGQGQGRQGGQAARAAAMPATCSRSMPFCRSTTAPR